MYKIGDFYNKDGVQGIVIWVDYTGEHGFLISLDEKHCNWHEAYTWCKNHGVGWRMPSYSDYQKIANDHVLSLIQDGLIQYGMPLCFGDENLEGQNHDGHIYWTNTEESDGFMYVYCLCYSGFKQFSSDYKEAEYEEIRAFYTF